MTTVEQLNLARIAYAIGEARGEWNTEGVRSGSVREMLCLGVKSLEALEYIAVQAMYSNGLPTANVSLNGGCVEVGVYGQTLRLIPGARQ